ncbi:EboA domain-containing protein [Streptomyces sp. NPDC047928]|uniref:EboA domain-containing protein n=1 Tax=unclassified Streptomyces TaxID=2593676 RepID=UPI003724133C
MLTSLARLEEDLDATARGWLHRALAEADHAGPATATTATTGASSAATTAATGASSSAATPAPWELRFASAGRHCGHEHADAVRVLLLRTARADTGTLHRLYRQGAAAERRAVLLALPSLVPGPDALPLVEDALRTHDARLLAAAVGPYAATHLPPHAWRHAVLKCLFTGVPLDAVAELPRRARADAELARMLVDHADERAAAGRPVPADLHRALAYTVPLEES